MLGVWSTSTEKNIFFVQANYELHFWSSVVLSYIKFLNVRSAESNVDILGVWMTGIFGIWDDSDVKTGKVRERVI